MIRQYILRTINSESKGDDIPLSTENEITFGRSPDCKIMLPDTNDVIAKHHCTFYINKNGMVYLRDAGSSSGTFVNGQDISYINKYKNPILSITLKDFGEGMRYWVRLTKKDKISIGGTTFSLIEKESPQVSFDPNSPLIGLVSDLNLEIPEIIDHYRIVQHIGEGAGGDVFYVEDNRTGEYSALKMLAYKTGSQADKTGIFLREIDTLKKLDHRNIIRFIDRGEKSGIYYFTTEFCNGGTIEELVKENQKLSLPRAFTLISQVLDALNYAHKLDLYPIKETVPQENMGLVHRDIKPTNVLIHHNRNDEIAKIADFGLAKFKSKSSSRGYKTTTGTVGGTVGFICRQQMVNYKHAKAEVDIWSAMAVFYYMLTGETPRVFDKSMPPFQVILTQKPIPIQERGVDIPDKLAIVIDQALNDEGILFYKSTEQLLNDLKGCQI